MKWLLLLVLFLSSVSAQNQNMGMSYLGLCNSTWPFKDSMTAFEGLKEIKLSVLAGATFGPDCQGLRRILWDSRPKTVRMHIANSTCQPERGRVCGSYEVFDNSGTASNERQILLNQGTWKRYVEQLNRAKDYVSASVGPLNLYLSPCLECDLGSKARKKMLDEAAKVFPSAVLVDNPIRDRCIDGVVCEQHGYGASPRARCIADLDGDDWQDGDMLKLATKFRNCDLDFIWGLKFNCVDHHNRNFVDPRKRDCSIANANYFRAASQILKANVPFELAPAPAQTYPGCRYQPISGGFVWKQSDTHSGAALLLNRTDKYAKIEVIKDRKVFETLVRSKDFSDGRPIYRGIKPLWDYPKSVVLRSPTNACWQLTRARWRTVP